MARILLQVDAACERVMLWEVHIFGESMNWLITTWLMAVSAGITLTLIHLTIWLIDRKNHVHLIFSTMVISVAGIAACELRMMTSDTPHEFGVWLRWAQIPEFIATICIVWLIHEFFQTGRSWLAGTICAMRLLMLIVNLIVSTNINPETIAQGQIPDWIMVGQLSSLLLLAYVVDASVTLWRQGNAIARRRAVVVGGSVALFTLIAVGHISLIYFGVIKIPYMVSPAFVIPIAAMGYEFSTDVARATQIGRDLQQSRIDLLDTTKSMDLAANAAELAMWKWDVNTNQIWVSEKGRPLFGLADRDPLTADHMLRVLHPDDREAFIHCIADSMSGKGEYQSEYRINLPKGQMRWILGRGRVEFDNDHKPILIRGVSVDVTGKKEVEQSLRERLREVVELAPIAMIVISSSGSITLVNTQTEVLFGYTRLELINQSIEALIPERLRAEYRSDFIAAIQAQARQPGRELLGRRKDGREIPIEFSLNSIQISEGTFILVSIIDISERKNIEKDRLRQRNELAHLSRVAMLGELSGSLAHELNQPLTAILSNAQTAQELLDNGLWDTDELRETLDDIIHENRRAVEVIRRLRRLFQKGEVQFEAIDINELVREVLTLMNSDLVIHDVMVQIELANDLPQIHGDRVQLQQVLINLIVNATDAMAGTRIFDRKLTVSTHLCDDEKVEICVSDTGSGIPQDELEQIFEPFHTSKPHGMGLGLAVCRTIIHAHAGQLWGTNNREGGASFHVALSPSLEGVSHE